MAASPQVAGPCEVQVNTGSAGALASLGWSRDNITPQRNRLLVNVPGDQNGGEDGNPIEIQDLGGFYSVHMELTKWDFSVAANVRTLGNPITSTGTGNPFLALATGAVPVPGSMIFSNTAYYRLLLKPLAPANIATVFAMNFLQAIPAQEPYSISLSSKFSVLVLDWICYPNASNVIWNTTTT